MARIAGSDSRLISRAGKLSISGSKSGSTRWRVFKAGPFLVHVTYVVKISSFPGIHPFSHVAAQISFLAAGKVKDRTKIGRENRLPVLLGPCYDASIAETSYRSFMQ